MKLFRGGMGSGVNSDEKSQGSGVYRHLSVLSQVDDRNFIKNSLRKVKSIRANSISDEAIKKDFDKLHSSEEKSSPLFRTKNDNKTQLEESKDEISLEDFKILKFLARGTFGSVFLAYLP